MSSSSSRSLASQVLIRALQVSPHHRLAGDAEVEELQQCTDPESSSIKIQYRRKPASMMSRQRIPTFALYTRTGRSSGDVEKYSNMLAAWSASSLDMIGDESGFSVVVLESKLSLVTSEDGRVEMTVDEADEMWLLAEEAGLEGEERSRSRSSFVVVASSCSTRARSVAIYSIVP